MMKTYCKREYYKQRQLDNQVYQLDGTSELLITASQGHFMQHCNNAGQILPLTHVNYALLNYLVIVFSELVLEWYHH